MPAFIIIASIVCAVWGVIFVRQFGLLGGCLAVLLVGSCLGHAFYHANIGPLPLTADRILLGVLLAVFVISRRWGLVPRQPLNQVDLLLIAFVAVLGICTFTHDWQAHGMRAAASLVFFYVLPLMIYFIARETPVSGRGLRGLYATLATFGVYLAVTAICEQQQIWGLVFPRYIVSDMQAEFLGRGRGPFLNPLGNGMFLCAGLFSLLIFWPRASRGGKAVILSLSVVFLAGIYCTLTRGVWLAAGSGLLILVALNLPRRWGFYLVVACGLLAVSAVTMEWNTLNAFKRDRDVSVADMSKSASLRPILAYLAWHVFLDHPLTGCGYRQYEDVSDYYLSDRSTSLQLERGRRYVQHNAFLSLLAETGMIGLGLFLLMWGAVLRAAWQLWRASSATLETRQFGLLMLLLIVCYVLMAMFHDLTLIPMVHMLMFLLAGITRGQQGALEWGGRHHLLLFEPLSLASARSSKRLTRCHRPG